MWTSSLDRRMARLFGIGRDCREFQNQGSSNVLSAWCLKIIHAKCCSINKSPHSMSLKLIIVYSFHDRSQSFCPSILVRTKTRRLFWVIMNLTWWPAMIGTNKLRNLSSCATQSEENNNFNCQSCDRRLRSIIKCQVMTPSSFLTGPINVQ